MTLDLPNIFIPDRRIIVPDRRIIVPRVIPKRQRWWNKLFAVGANVTNAGGIVTNAGEKVCETTDPKACCPTAGSGGPCTVCPDCDSTPTQWLVTFSGFAVPATGCLPISSDTENCIHYEGGLDGISYFLTHEECCTWTHSDLYRWDATFGVIDYLGSGTGPVVQYTAPGDLSFPNQCVACDNTAYYHIAEGIFLEVGVSLGQVRFSMSIPTFDGVNAIFDGIAGADPSDPPIACNDSFTVELPSYILGVQGNFLFPDGGSAVLSPIT